jgi:hypothetical protein
MLLLKQEDNVQFSQSVFLPLGRQVEMNNLMASNERDGGFSLRILAFQWRVRRSPRWVEDRASWPPDEWQMTEQNSYTNAPLRQQTRNTHATPSNKRINMQVYIDK